ncbi:MAG TPA: DUF1328 domain-containing protein [Planctomycetota bacterium]|nr:DUF1328 domain-containing protein [Planctomycetota bacterium]
MLTWSQAFSVLPFPAALRGSCGIASGATGTSQACLFLLLTAFVASGIWRLGMGRRSAPPFLKYF